MIYLGQPLTIKTRKELLDTIKPAMRPALPPAARHRLVAINSQ